MSDFFNRMINLVKGAGHSLLKDLERDNPEAVYQAAVDAQAGVVRDTHSALAALISRRKQIEQAQKQLPREMEALAVQAAGMMSSQEARALELLEKKATLGVRLQDMALELPQLEQRIRAQELALESARGELGRVKAERDEVLLQLRLLEQTESRSGVSSAPAMAALQAVRERLEQLGSLGSGDGAGGSSPGARQAAIKEQALAELERLRAQGSSPGAQPQQSSSDPLTRNWEERPPADATTTPAGPEGDDLSPIPKRSL